MFDVIVIGAGLGGLLTAGILARRGRRVLVLEREAAVGGRLRSYDCDGYVIDAGAYLWPNKHLDAALAAAGVTGFRASTIPPTQVMRLFVQGTGGARLSFPWPGRPESAALLDTGRVALGADADVFRRLTRFWNDLATWDDAAVAAVMHEPVETALWRHAPDPAVAEAWQRNVMLFGTSTPEHASFGECIGLVRRAPDGAARPECPGANPAGGVRALPLAIRSALDDAGVDVRTDYSVDHILIEEACVAGVDARHRTPFRETFAAPAVVCNVPIWRLFDLVSPDFFPPELVAHAHARVAVGGTVNAAFVFRDPPCLRQTREPDTFPGWTRLLVGDERCFGGGMLWTTRHSPHNAPAGAHILQAMRVSPHADVSDPRRVQHILDGFRTMLDEIYLDAAAKLVWWRTWITRDGTDYLLCAAPRPPVAAPGIRGLYFVGESTDVPAVQMDAAALSALRCAELIEQSRVKS